MTVYSVKVNNHKIVKTTSLHEARSLAKQLLADRIADVKKWIAMCNRNDPCPYPPYINSVSEKMYIRGTEVEYCFYATVVLAKGQRKTYRTTIKAENVALSGYDFDLHTEIVNRLAKREQVNQEMGTE